MLRSGYMDENKETAEKKVLSELLRELELDPSILEKIGFAVRAFHVFRTFDVVPFGDCEFEDFFCLACLAASLMAGDRDAEIENACEIIALCLELSCGRQEGERWKEGAASDT
jgi:hypothetical protein